jgi:hypothetical protein
MKAQSDAYKVTMTRTIHLIIPTAAGMNLLEKMRKKTALAAMRMGSILIVRAREHRARPGSRIKRQNKR